MAWILIVGIEAEMKIEGPNDAIISHSWPSLKVLVIEYSQPVSNPSPRAFGALPFAVGP
jgi:hypothetical protein